ncbi:Mitochondrial inner membrane protease subunit 2 [Penicillium ucsense]|uniref:Mitochondrial inner membrane protease subunit 2 n=1 Tax=Penicillium ucsense TaxID=2839758 RepID=A0A8J8VW45_9EURO|nr:Mitochondrial inner membrane protease subunit 2 [Penicillium ucsense]KAF7731293.1 Mitochondrial inner membrane protease subunit 2 [Penicillium ucsense]
MPPPDRMVGKLSKLRAINPTDAKLLARNGKPLPKRSANAAPPPQPEPQPEPAFSSEHYGPSLGRRRLFEPLRNTFARFRQRCRKLPTPILLSARSVRVMIPIVPIGYFLTDNVMRITKVNGPSMTPYLNENYDQMHTQSDTALIQMWSKHRWIPWKDGRRLERGMVVIFPSPADPSRKAVKRIVGLPGDRVTNRDFPKEGAHLVPWNHVWVEGDAANQQRSMDSNSYGPISISMIEGVAIAVLSPRMRWLNWKDWESKDVDAAGSNGRLRPDYRKSIQDRIVKNAAKVERPPEW